MAADSVPSAWRRSRRAEPAARLDPQPDAGVEAEQADAVAGLERHVAEQQRRGDRVVELRDAGEGPGARPGAGAAAAGR
jgi:hypothetical protein